MARTELIKFRVTPAEKAHIVTQAGGARQVSEHLRGLALRGYEDGGEEQQAEASEVALLPSAAQPSAQADLPAPAQSKRIEAVIIDETRHMSEPSAECPRWMHHRSGTYCGSCKTVPK